jgi:phage baseplate assembly protein W
LATLFLDIKSKDWQISTQGVGLVAEGLEDIRQCLDICLRTTKGTDPLRPQFGSDIFQYVDKPLTVAIPNMIRAIIETVQIWEKRVALEKVKYQTRDTSTVDFFITYRLVDEELIDLLKLQLDNGILTPILTQIGTLTIFALFPPNPTHKRYQVDFHANGVVALPPAPAGGFATQMDLYAWVAANWSGYGSWQMAANKIIGHLIPEIQQAEISIILIGTIKYTAIIPNLSTGQSWQVELNTGTQLLLSDSFTTVSQMIIWLNVNWFQFGVWNIESNPGAGGEFDISDFVDTEFVAGSPFAYILALLSETLNNATLEVSIV